MRRLFGKSELEIMKKQLMNVNLTGSEKTRLSRDIKPKLKIIKKLSNFKDEFEFKKGQEIRFLIEQAKEVILESVNPSKIKKIILFGSFIENKMNFNSDIDIAVEFNKINKIDAGKFRLKVLKNLDEKIDFQIYNVLPEKIKKEIERKGRILWKAE